MDDNEDDAEDNDNNDECEDDKRDEPHSQTPLSVRRNISDNEWITSLGHDTNLNPSVSKAEAISRLSINRNDSSREEKVKHKS